MEDELLNRRLAEALEAEQNLIKDQARKEIQEKIREVERRVKVGREDLARARKSKGSTSKKSLTELERAQKKLNVREGGADDLGATTQRVAQLLMGAGKSSKGAGRNKKEVKWGDSTSSSESSSESSSSDSDSSKKKKKRKKKKKSGILESSKNTVKRRLKFPHVALMPQFLRGKTSLSFQELTFPLFVAGELEIIMGRIDSSKKSEEMVPRLKLLRRLAYRADNMDFKIVKNVYEAVLRNIEKGKATWDSDFQAIETQVLESSADKYSKFKEPASPRTKFQIDLKKKRVFWCAAFNQGECTEAAPHTASVMGEDRTVLHVCASCLNKDKIQVAHGARDSSCPHKE